MQTGNRTITRVAAWHFTSCTCVYCAIGAFRSVEAGVHAKVSLRVKGGGGASRRQQQAAGSWRQGCTPQALAASHRLNTPLLCNSTKHTHPRTCSRFSSSTKFLPLVACPWLRLRFSCKGASMHSVVTAHVSDDCDRLPELLTNQQASSRMPCPLLLFAIVSKQRTLCLVLRASRTWIPPSLDDCEKVKARSAHLLVPRLLALLALRRRRLAQRRRVRRAAHRYDSRLLSARRRRLARAAAVLGGGNEGGGWGVVRSGSARDCASALRPLAARTTSLRAAARTML